MLKSNQRFLELQELRAKVEEASHNSHLWLVSHHHCPLKASARLKENHSYSPY